MDITVKGSSMICPAQDTPKERQWISNVDLAMTTFHVPLLYFYRPNPSFDPFKAQVLKEALSKILVPFYPMAGRLGSDENGRPQIICNAEGVLFIEAETTCAIDDLGDFVPSLKLRQLVPTVDYSGDTSSYPLLLAQASIPPKQELIVTAFKGGGVSLGIGIHHTLADGTTSFHFINCWSEIARGLSQITEAPFIDRTLLRARIPPTPKFHHVEYDPPPSLKTSDPNPKPTSVSVFKITPDQLNNLKTNSFKNQNATKYSTYAILAAHIWRCASKARGLLDDQPTKLYMPINGRPRLHPPLPSGYLGNAIFLASLIALYGNLQSEPFINTIEKIHGKLKRMDDEYLRSALDYLEELSDISVVRRGPQHFQCPNLSINNWMRFPLYNANFGWGRPIYMGLANVAPEGKMCLLPSPTDDGSLSLIACLQTSHMKLFRKHLYEGLMAFDKIRARC
ncbi:hypothetical protein DITRI_Ditri10aG0128300 [Diplodiscus trichospermus]